MDAALRANWEAACQQVCRRIEEEIARESARFTEATLGTQKSDTIAQLSLDYFLNQFDIAAHYTQYLIWDSALVTVFYEPYLKRQAQRVIDNARAWTREWWPRAESEFLGKLGAHLQGRKEHWKAQAMKTAREMPRRRDANEEKGNRTSLENSTYTATVAVKESSSLDRLRQRAEPRFPNRAAWLQARLVERSWNRNDPSRQRGPDVKTISKILEGKPVREEVMEKLARALSQKVAQVTILDIPQD